MGVLDDSPFRSHLYLSPVSNSTGPSLFILINCKLDHPVGVSQKKNVWWRTVPSEAPFDQLMKLVLGDTCKLQTYYI